MVDHRSGGRVGAGPASTLHAQVVLHDRGGGSYTKHSEHGPGHNYGGNLQVLPMQQQRQQQQQ